MELMRRQSPKMQPEVLHSDDDDQGTVPKSAGKGGVKKKAGLQAG